MILGRGNADANYIELYDDSLLCDCDDMDAYPFGYFLNEDLNKKVFRIGVVEGSLHSAIAQDIFEEIVVKYPFLKEMGRELWWGILGTAETRGRIWAKRKYIAFYNYETITPKIMSDLARNLKNNGISNIEEFNVLYNKENGIVFSETVRDFIKNGTVITAKNKMPIEDEDLEAIDNAKNKIKEFFTVKTYQGKNAWKQDPKIRRYLYAENIIRQTVRDVVRKYLRD